MTLSSGRPALNGKSSVYSVVRPYIIGAFAIATAILENKFSSRTASKGTVCVQMPISNGVFVTAERIKANADIPLLTANSITFVTLKAIAYSYRALLL